MPKILFLTNLCFHYGSLLILLHFHYERLSFAVTLSNAMVHGIYVPHVLELVPTEISNQFYKDENLDWQRVASELTVIARRNKIALLDPSEIFRKKTRELASDQKGLYFPRDGHWNELGHEAAADLLSKHVLHSLALTR